MKEINIPKLGKLIINSKLFQVLAPAGLGLVVGTILVGPLREAGIIETPEVNVVAWASDDIEDYRNQKLAGVGFELIYENADKVASWVSSEDGVQNICNLEDGEYILRVVDVPEGYDFLSKSEAPVTIDRENGFSYIEVTICFEETNELVNSNNVNTLTRK